MVPKASDLDDTSEQEKLLGLDIRRMARPKLHPRLEVVFKPVQISVLAAFLLLAIISLSTSYYWEYNFTVSSCSNSVAALPPERLNRVNTTHSYGTCIVLVIGDDGGVPSLRALPYGMIRRIFQRVLKVEGVVGSVGLVEPNLQDVLVRTDYTSLVCKMAKDALGPAVKCESFLKLPSVEQRVSCKTLVVGHTTKYIEQACPEWTSEVYYKEREVIYLDTPDRTQEPVVLPEWRPTIVTAFSANHFKYGLLLLRSIGKAASHSSVSRKYRVSVVAWTMDELSGEQQNYLDCVIKELKALGVEAEARRFPFEKYPVWMRLNKDLIAIHDGGKGARPLPFNLLLKATFHFSKMQQNIGSQHAAFSAGCTLRVCMESDNGPYCTTGTGFILWLDAGGRILTPVALKESLDWVKNNGFGGHKSEGNVGQWTHPGQLKFFRADYRYIKQQRNCDASRIGFTLKTYKKMFRPWYECSITRQCIAPEGSDRFNHRQDQAALSLLSYMTGLYCIGLSDDVIRHTDNYGFDFYGGVDETLCYEDSIKA